MHKMLKLNPNQRSSLRTARMCLSLRTTVRTVLIIFPQFSYLFSRQSSQLRCCLLEGGENMLKIWQTFKGCYKRCKRANLTWHTITGPSHSHRHHRQKMFGCTWYMQTNRQTDTLIATLRTPLREKLLSEFATSVCSKM